MKQKERERKREKQIYFKEVVNATMEVMSRKSVWPALRLDARSGLYAAAIGQDSQCRLLF